LLSAFNLPKSYVEICSEKKHSHTNDFSLEIKQKSAVVEFALSLPAGSQVYTINPSDKPCAVLIWYVTSLTCPP